MKKVSELNSTELAYWVAMAQDLDAMIDDGICYIQDKFPKAAHHTYQPQENWAQCGLLIDKFEISISSCWVCGGEERLVWTADEKQSSEQESDNPKTAICRSVVASVYGEFVPSDL